MIYVLHLIGLAPEDSAAWPVVFDAPGGLWPILAGTLTGHVHTQLMQQSGNRNSYLILEFWESEVAYFRAQESPQAQAFHQWLLRSTRSYQKIGVFRFLRDGKSPCRRLHEREMPRQHQDEFKDDASFPDNRKQSSQTGKDAEGSNMTDNTGEDSQARYSLDDGIEVLELWPRAQDRLRDAGIDCISDLVKLDEDKLQNMGLTPEWIEDTKETLGKLGLRLGT